MDGKRISEIYEAELGMASVLPDCTRAEIERVMAIAVAEAAAEMRERCAIAAGCYIGPTDRLCLRIAADIRTLPLDGGGVAIRAGATPP